MDAFNIDAETLTYIRSESEFSRAKMRGFLEMILGMITGHNMHLLSFDNIVDKLRLKQSIYRGLQDIPIDHIVGSTGRYSDFTRHFLPRSRDSRDKERWRNIYTRAVTGKGFPPIDVYKIDQAYFVKDGNHRVSVARDLGWKIIQAYVTEVSSSISLNPDVRPDELLIKEECAYFLAQTRLDRTRPSSRYHIDLTEPGGYQRLLHHVELHRYLLEEETEEPLSDDRGEALHLAAADWYDHVYLPLVDVVRRMQVIEQFPGRSEADLYMWLVEHQTELREHHNLDKTILPGAVEGFLNTLQENPGKN